MGEDKTSTGKNKPSLHNDEPGGLSNSKGYLTDSTNEKREVWTSQIEFFLSCLGYAVGLGNVWRFPYLCYRHGGGAFLIPYVFMMTFCGLPLFFMELSLGQFHGKGPNIVFRHLLPIFHGLGYAMLVLTFLVALYYNIIMAWTFFFTFASFTSHLGWEFCGNEWNTIACYNKDQNEECVKRNLTYWNNTCYNVEDYCNGIVNFTYANITHCVHLPITSFNEAVYVPAVKATKRVSPSEDYYQDAVLIALSNCCTSVFAGFVIFSILGFMAYTLDVRIEDVVDSGQGLAFIAYPQAITKLPISPLWSFMFFFMFITLGLDSQFTMCETLITAIQDEWPVLRSSKPWIVIVTCSICFLLGLPMCARGGVYLFTMLDWYSASWSVLLIGLLECILLSWIYGINRYLNNVKQMIGYRPNIYWLITWLVITPVIIIGVLIFSFMNSTSASYGNYKFPKWTISVGWMLGAVSVIMIPLFALYEVWKTKTQGKEWRDLFRPTADWGPAVEANETKNVESETLNSQPHGLGKQHNVAAQYDNPIFIYATSV
ncbi:sodium-dependent proline transporter-like isoform X4 [Tachypleus tridentatus]|uniref:sodium-dependent proline transporter-like isoform X4 n=1 Tax=Tachypleus tridentatus TaxID=6853 RepID=UPI003FD156C7